LFDFTYCEKAADLDYMKYKITSNVMLHLKEEVVRGVNELALKYRGEEDLKTILDRVKSKLFQHQR